VPVELVPVVQAACTRAIAVVERRRTVQFLEQSFAGRDAASWLKEVEEEALAALEERGEALSTELSDQLPRMAEKIAFEVGNAPASQSVASRVLPLLAADGRAVRGRPRGSWTSGQYRWSTMRAWLPDGVPELPADEARVELAGRWLRAFGPAPVADLKWWSGWTLGHTRAALAGLAVVEVDLDGVPGVALADDLAPTPLPEPHPTLLPALDASVMGWQSRGWFLGDHGRTLFDTNGNAGPTVWWDGRVVGGWAQRRTGEVVVRLLEDVGADAVTAVDAAAARLRDWIGPVRVTPRFRTPLERQLAA
ncbi:MAG TPA: winged helix DNA-binding domain-containing protein, partial [Mycobacteriales bacterium]|nr:winged helix DNA-binding domain-containing protein [Mycobacteriales bacterium]